MKCDYYGCPNDAQADPDIKEGMQFCAEHDAQFTAAAHDENPMRILGFWVKAQGGAERATKRMMGDE